MPAIATLKVMPRGCFSCPFCINGTFDETSCLVLDRNRIDYEIDVNIDLNKHRRKECPLTFVKKDERYQCQTEKTLSILLDALSFYKAISLESLEDQEIIDEQIGAIRANLYGEEQGWRSKEEQIAYEARRAKEMDKLLQELIEMAKNDSK